MKKSGTWFRRRKLRRSKSNASIDSANFGDMDYHTTIYKENTANALRHSTEDFSIRATTSQANYDDRQRYYSLTRNQERVAKYAHFQSALYVNKDEERRFLEREEKLRNDYFEQMEKCQFQESDREKPKDEERKHHHYRGFIKRIFRSKQ